MNPVSIAIVNDYEVVAHGLAAMLRAYQHRIRVVELDLNRPVSDPVDLALYDTFAATQGDRAEVRTLVANPSVRRVAIYSWNLDQVLIDAALVNGASGYISKGLPAAQLVGAIEQIHGGEQSIHLGKKDSIAVVAGDWPGREEGLTQREAEVLALITQGLSNAEIADRAHLSLNSVKTYIRNCYRRIAVTSRTQAVLWGVEHGFRPDRTRIMHPEPDAKPTASPRPDESGTADA